MTANQAKIRQCFTNGLTTVDAIREHVSCSDSTITSVLATIRQELVNTKELDLTTYLKSDAQNCLVEHTKTLQDDLNIIIESMKLCVGGDRNWMTYQKRKTELLAEIRKLNGADILVKVAEKRALNQVEAVETKKLTQAPLPSVFVLPEDGVQE